MSEAKFRRVKCPKCGLKFMAGFALDQEEKVQFCPKCGWVGEGEAPDWAKALEKDRRDCDD